MNQSFFNKLISQISSKLKMMEELGVEITDDFIDEKINEVVNEFKVIPNFKMTEEDVKRIKFHLGSMFNVRIGQAAITLHNPDLPRWFKSKKSEIKWVHWQAYKDMLISQARSIDVIDANEDVIDSILDYSGDPQTPGKWSRKGLVMGNVQSGKTQNYLGLINKAIDSGYKIIIVLGGHLNDLRKQTQERIDEGVLGRESKHLLVAKKSTPSPIGVGSFRINNVNTGTTTVEDFTSSFANSLGFSLRGADPVVFTIKKHTKVMESLYNWIKDHHYLNPEDGIRLDSPMMLIDDEADYASINTKHHKEEVTKTNDYIRDLLSLFDRNTYVGYTATPFANIFIDPDDNAYSDKDDLFPSDFMVKIPVPDDYMGQDFFFGGDTTPESEQNNVEDKVNNPIVIVEDHEPIFELKKHDDIYELPKSLKEAVRAFVITVAVRNLRGEKNSHNTMLVNISHLKDHQNKLELLISEYHREIVQAINVYSGLGVIQARNSAVLNEMERTCNDVFVLDESYEEIFDQLQDSAGKINVWAINQSNKKADNKELDYSKHKENGLCAIVIGGHKLSRGLTLEGLSITYFARNSKAYDTLMQMCRWFGYRPTYKDLCRVYLPEESLEWYSFISSSIRELYSELDLMSKREERPRYFGLKVREHPGAMVITAKNKMGYSESEVRTQDLWGQVQRRFKFREHSSVNDKNISYSENFIKKLFDENKVDKNLTKGANSPVVFSDVEYCNVIDFIRNIDLPEDDVGNSALINQLRKMEKSGLKKFKVCLFNQKERREPRWFKKLSLDEQEFINKSYNFSGEDINLPKRAMNLKDGNFLIPSVNLANPDDEKVFISGEGREVVAKSVGNKKPVSFDYMSSEERDFPALIIYLFAVAHVSSPFPFKEGLSKVKLAHGYSPTLGYSLSINRSDNLKGKSQKEINELIKNTRHSYHINKVQSQLKLIADYEDYDDE